MEVECMRRCRSHQHGAAICAAILRGSEEEAVAYMRWLCANCAQVTDNWGRTALHVAASKGRRRVVEWLVKHRDAVLNARDQESGYTPLHRSLFYGQIDVAISLIKMGSNVGAMDKEDLTPIDHSMKSRLAYIEFLPTGVCEAYLWGTNANFNLGLGNQHSRSIPEPLEHFRRQGISIKQVALHMYHSVFVSSNGRVYSCGHGQGGRLGQVSEQPSLLPQPIKLPATEVCVYASIGSDHTVLLMESGSVWTCGSNQQHQLGHNPPPPGLLAPRSIPQRSLPTKVLGITAGRFHTVIWSQDAIRTCGLNAGQLGHPKGDSTVIIPKQVSSLQHTDCHITHVASSDAATVVVMKKGTIHVLHEYQCRKIASRMLHVKQVVVSGGRLDSDLEPISEELRVCVLTTTGKLLIWQQSTQQLTKCMLQLKRALIITNVALTSTQFLFTTNDGEAFEGFLQPRKKSAEVLVSPSGKGNQETREEWEHMRVRKLAHVHRAVNVSCDPRGRNFAVIQAHPKESLLEVPQVETSTMREQMATLLKEACEEDDIHDIIFQVEDCRIAAHRCVVGAHSEVLAQLMSDAINEQEEEIPRVKIDNIKPEIFKQILQFIYTNQCDLLVPGPCQIKFEQNKQDKKKHVKKKKSPEKELKFDPNRVSAFEVYEELDINKGNKAKQRKTSVESNVNNDPLRGVAASARQLGLQSLSKALESVTFKNGVIELRSGYNQYKPLPVSFDREQLKSLCDVSVMSLEGDELSAHRSILAARLEYFYSMFAHGWAEASRNAKLSMALPTTVLEVLLNFLYCDKAPQVYEDPKLARTMLVVADQMFIERLKEECECALASIMNLCNAAELLQFAATYNAPQLKLTCMQFISINLPAIIEARSLEEVEWDVLSDLTRYYRENTPSMWRRCLSPYCETPSSAELESLLASFPVDLDQDVDPEERRELLESKKFKIKKRHRIRRISSGETQLSRNRNESISSNASDDIEDHERGIHPLPLAEEEGVTLHPILTPPSTPPAEPAKVVEVKKQWNVMFPDLTASVAAIDINAKPKSSDSKKVVKLSQKQRKRLASESGMSTVSVAPATPTSPKPAWGVYSTSPGGQGLQDIMREEKQQAWTSASPVPVLDMNKIRTTSPMTIPARQMSVPSAQSPPGQAWGASSSSGQSFQAIVADELQQKQNLQRVRTKSLHLTQIEDQAIEDLLNFYGAHDCTDERITVRRVETGAVATPIWVNNHR